MVEMYSATKASKSSRLIILLAELILMLLAAWILFSPTVDLWFLELKAGNLLRRQALMIMHGIVFFRFAITLFVFLKRKIPAEELISIPLAFALYYIGFSLAGYGNPEPPGPGEYTGFILFITGSLLNSGSEWQRHLWKKDPAHSGQLYTKGLFAYSMHINFFGDFLWVSGYAFVTASLWAFLIPALLLIFFVFFNIPQLDSYLAVKYGAAFEDYRKRTKKLVPFLY